MINLVSSVHAPIDTDGDGQQGHSQNGVASAVPSANQSDSRNPVSYCSKNKRIKVVQEGHH